MKYCRDGSRKTRGMIHYRDAVARKKIDKERDKVKLSFVLLRLGVKLISTR